MKKQILTFGLILFTIVAFAQESTTVKKNVLPSVEVKTMDGKKINVKNLSNNGKPMIISFWATWCKPCIKELTSIADVYEQWQKETGVKLIAVSVDDSRSSSKVPTVVDGKGWDYEVLLDLNGDLKRAMNVNEVPHMFIVNGNGEIVWQHTSFADGGEVEIINIIKKIIAGEPIPAN
ncbi:MAG: TlpA disulfide reductase family protein [Bacteroidota bacterium]